MRRDRIRIEAVMACVDVERNKPRAGKVCRLKWLSAIITKPISAGVLSVFRPNLDDDGLGNPVHTHVVGKVPQKGFKEKPIGQPYRIGIVTVNHEMHANCSTAAALSVMSVILTSTRHLALWT